MDELSAIYRPDERRKNVLQNFRSLNDEDQEKLVGAVEIVAKLCEGAQKEKAAPEISEADMEAYDRVNAWLDAHMEERVKKEQASPSAPSVESDVG